MEQSEAEKRKTKLLEIEMKIGAPVKLSEVEKDKFIETFDLLKGLLDDSQDSVLEMDRDAAYRYIRLLVAGLLRVDVDFVAGVTKPSEPPEVRPEGGEEETETIPVPDPVVRPTAEQVSGWLDSMTPKAKVIANERLDCIKQYLDPDGPGIDIICNFCSKDKMAQCIRDEDPSFKDAGSVFMEIQLEGG